jgi:hypothetical protein
LTDELFWARKGRSNTWMPQVEARRGRSSPMCLCSHARSGAGLTSLSSESHCQSPPVKQRLQRRATILTKILNVWLNAINRP